MPVLDTDRGFVRVVPGRLLCDAHEFEMRLRAGNAAVAAACYEGELLPGYYDDWVDEEWQRLAGLL